MAKAKTDDQILKKAKAKIGELIDRKETSVDEAVALSTALSKLIAVELKMSDDEWGSDLGGKE